MAGIKPKKIIVIGFNDDEPIFKSIPQDEQTEFRIIKENVYPNFETNAENFLKLLEIMFQYDFDFKKLETYVISVLNGAIEECENKNEDFIQALQNEEWNYE